MIMEKTEIRKIKAVMVTNMCCDECEAILTGVSRHPAPGVTMYDYHCESCKTTIITSQRYPKQEIILEPLMPEFK
jgi:hypothetical protein